MQMSISMTVREVIGEDAENCSSRSLLLDRFAHPESKDKIVEKLLRKSPFREKSDSWIRWLRFGGLGLLPKDILVARLMARMAVNASGGILENASLCLDRFGVAYIPGSAVKGCARRWAIHRLLEMRETGKQVEVLVSFLADVALTFGWCERDWVISDAADSPLSDFVSAVGLEAWPNVLAQVRPLLKKGDASKLADFGNFAGAVSFFPAYPLSWPHHDLELDIIACHHPKYYSEPMEPDVQHTDRKWITWKAGHNQWASEWGNAPDTEEPNLVTFPTAAAGITFAFAALPLRCVRESLSTPARKLHELAKEWLANGLAGFGVGAKTAAGYGWFEDVSTEHHDAWLLEDDLRHFRDAANRFALMDNVQKDELVLNLCERADVCGLLRRHDRVRFQLLESYAQEQGVPLP